MEEHVDTLIKGTLVNVHTGTLEDRSVAIDNGEIVALEERSADRVFEANFIAPGLVDAHVHVESSMVTLPKYGEAVVPRGVTGIVHDPHEIANVLGEDGVRAAIADAEKTPLKARFGVPSSVPATSLQDAGATLDASAVQTLLDMEAVVALAEVMDISGVISGEEEIHKKILAARERGLTVDGHLPRVSGSVLQEAARYLETDHESISPDELLKKYRTGFQVYLREGSTSKNLADLLPALRNVDSRHVSLCTDDRNTVDLVDRGGIDFAVRKAIAEGADPVEVVQMSTINTAESYGLPFGRVQPGAPADIVLLDDLGTWDVDHVLIDGTLDPTRTETTTETTALTTDTVTFETVNPPDLGHASTSQATSEHRVRVIDVGEFQTERLEATVSSEDDVLRANLADDILPAAVIERHGKGAGIGTGFVHGFGLDRGAIGSTIAHDAHNLVVVGTSHSAMATVANHLKEIGGGISVFDPETAEFTSVPLPVAGLMSDKPLRTVKREFQSLEDAAKRIGFSHPGGIMEITFIALEVIPDVRLTNKGLVDVERQELLNVEITEGNE
jgi:adenine deaminase